MQSLKYFFALSLLTLNLNSAVLNQWQIITLITSAQAARENSYSPYSKFKVGAAILTKSGKVFSGANVENASYGLTICAERSAIVAAVSKGLVSRDKEKRIQAIAVVLDVEKPEAASPCGTCRQFIWEFAQDKDMPVIMCKADGSYIIETIGDLLKHPFELEE